MKKILNKPLSDQEIRKYGLPALLKSEFKGDLPVIILYEQTPRNGHWSLLHETVDNDGNSVVEFFDSYGMKPDDAIDVLRIIEDKTIVKFLLQNDKNIEYSPYQLQELKPGISTCGRHCILRYLMHHIPIDEYVDRLDAIAKKTGYNYDLIVSKIIND